MLHGGRARSPVGSSYVAFAGTGPHGRSQRADPAQFGSPVVYVPALPSPHKHGNLEGTVGVGPQEETLTQRFCASELLGRIPRKDQWGPHGPGRRGLPKQRLTHGAWGPLSAVPARPLLAGQAPPRCPDR